MSSAIGDFQLYCSDAWQVCPLPVNLTSIDESSFFTPKPDSAKVAPPASGKSINVLHLSDWHLDPRHDIGIEANCTEYICCRPFSTNHVLNTTTSNASIPASRFGSLLCDSPPDLALSSFIVCPNSSISRMCPSPSPREILSPTTRTITYLKHTSNTKKKSPTTPSKPHLAICPFTLPSVTTIATLSASTRPST